MPVPSDLFPGVPGPIVTIVLDGFGISPHIQGNAIAQAHTPTLDRLFARFPHRVLQAHGTAVGMPSDEDMGNSEVGHNAIGAGQVYHQGAALVSQAIATKTLFDGNAWHDILSHTRARSSTLHFIGLFSDGNVHSHIDHLKALIERAQYEGQHRVRLHILLDGRDVPDTSALDYLHPFEAFLKRLSSPDFDICIASGGGRMKITMDRYEADWGMVEKGWKTHVHGEGRYFDSAEQAILTLRSENPGVTDQDLPAFVIARNSEPVGRITDGDSVICFNFRGDRAIEISRAFEEGSEFTRFDRGPIPQIAYAGMLQYDGDLRIPRRYLVEPPAIRHTLGEWLAHQGITQLALSETQKFGHVTYFWNGNRSGKFDESRETYIEIPSDNVPFEQRPWMKSAEITDTLIDKLKTGQFKTVRVNYPNGDMVGHTGHFQATRVAIEALDLALGRLLPVVDAMKGIALITADHGNADEMYELDKKTGEPKKDKEGRFKAKTAHTLNPVPLILYDNQTNGALRLAEGTFKLSHLAATTAHLLGRTPPDIWDRSMLEYRL